MRAANVGAMRLSRLAARMEELASAGDLTSMAGLMADLERDFAAARDRLAAILESTPEPEA
jgi:hypothetical protein